MPKKIKKFILLVETNDRGEIVRLRQVNQDADGVHGFGEVILTTSDRNQMKALVNKLAKALEV